MQKITAFNQNNQALEIEMIRYFKKNDKKYLIFTLGEVDEQGYAKIYVSKILGLNGTLAAYDIIDETEWANVKEIIKTIIKANRENSVLDIEDLSIERLFNIKINGQQVFKLMNNLIELLGSNINAQSDDISDDSGMIEQVVSEPTISNEIEQENIVPQVEEPIETNPIETNQESLSATNVSDYQNLYQELFDKYEQLVQENAKLKTQLENIKAIMND